MLKFTGFTHYTVHRVDLKFQFFSMKGCGDTKPGTFCPSQHWSKLTVWSFLTVCSRKRSILSISALTKLTGQSILTNAETDKIDPVLISTNLHTNQTILLFLWNFVFCFVSIPFLYILEPYLKRFLIPIQIVC